MLNFQNVKEAQTLAQAIVNTIPEPFLVLDDQFRVLAASRSFYQTFKVDPEDTRGRLLFSLGEGQWDIPALRLLLETIIPQHAAMDGFEVDHDFPNIGRRLMLLNARTVQYDDSANATILLAFTDVTERRAIELEKAALLAETEELLRQKQVLLQEIQHRVGNSLQIIASILLLKAKAVTSEETRGHLKDAHQRVLSVAAVQQYLNTSDAVDQIEVEDYLTKLCVGLASSMIGESQPIVIKVSADNGRIASTDAVSIGLIVTELVINAVKYAFPTSKPGAEVLVNYESNDPDWTLTVSDNGVGTGPTQPSGRKGGLGTAIVQALVKQLNATMETVSGAEGLRVAILHTPLAHPVSSVA
jgi:two-component sensor histidine kinase